MPTPSLDDDHVDEAVTRHSRACVEEAALTLDRSPRIVHTAACSASNEVLALHVESIRLGSYVSRAWARQEEVRAFRPGVLAAGPDKTLNSSGARTRSEASPVHRPRVCAVFAETAIGASGTA